VLTLAETGSNNFVDTGDPAADFAGFHVRFTVPAFIADFKVTISDAAGLGTQMELNGLQIIENVPEPSSLALAVLGLAGLVVCRQRRGRGR